MLTILYRTVLIYAVLSCIVRLMGKRQIGELEISDFVTTFLVSEIAALPIENPEIPVLYAVVPLVTLLFLEVSMSALLARFPKLRQKTEAPPSMLICRGKIRREELLRNRISVDELLAGLRQQGVSDPGEVEYAVMEKNGKLSVILWEAFRPATASDVKAETKEKGIYHLLISDGVLHPGGLTALGRDETWLREQLEMRNITREEVYYLLCNDTGDVRWEKKAEENSVPREGKCQV